MVRQSTIDQISYCFATSCLCQHLCPWYQKDSLVIGCDLLPFLFCNDGRKSISGYLWSFSFTCLKGELSRLKTGEGYPMSTFITHTFLYCTYLYVYSMYSYFFKIWHISYMPFIFTDWSCLYSEISISFPWFTSKHWDFCRGKVLGMFFPEKKQKTWWCRLGMHS